MKQYIKKTKKALWLSVLILTGAITGCSSQEEKKESLQLIDYIEAEYVGTKEDFQVTLKTDIDKIQEKYEEIKEDKSVIDAVVFSKFMQGITLEYDENNTSYKNGDKIHVKFHWDDQAAEECMYQTESEADFEVNISEKTEKLDPFEGLNVTFMGMNGEGWMDYNEANCQTIVKEKGVFLPVSVNGEGEEEDELLYDSLKNGDKVTLEFTWRDKGRAYRKENMLMSRNKKEYIVEGLGDYVETVKAEDFEKYNQIILEYTKEQIRSWKGNEHYMVTPYQYYYYYNQNYKGENAYVGIYKVENTAIPNDTFYFVSLTYPLYYRSTGEVEIESYLSDGGKEIYVMSADSQQRCVMGEEELEDLATFLDKNDWIDLDIESYQFSEVK